MSFENELSPNQNLLVKDGENVSAEIIDGEQDVLKCFFNNDGCVQIDTEFLSYITLSQSNLDALIELIAEADNYFINNLVESKEK